MSNYNIFNSVSRGSLWHGKMKSENENLVENLKGNKSFKNAENRNNFKIEKVWRKKSVNWNHTDSILNWNQKYSDSIHIDSNHTNSNQPIPADLTNIRSIYDSDNIYTIENISASPVSSPVQVSPIFTYGSASGSPSTSHDSSSESVTPKGNPKSYNN